MAGLLYIGEVTPNGGAVRIMKSPSGNPHTTPRTDYDAFAFDSESGDLAYAYGINSGIGGVGYIPVLTSSANWEGDWWELPGWKTQAGATSGQLERTNIQATINDGTPNVETNPSGATKRYLVWQLPATSAATPFPASTGKIPGMVAEDGKLRIPRAGKSFTSGDLTDYIVHEGLRPAKVVAAGRVAINAGTTAQIALPSAVPAGAFVGGHFNDDFNAVTVPYVRTTGASNLADRRIQTRIVNNGLTLEIRERSGIASNVSYFVVAEDESGTTSGSADVIKSDTDGQGTSYLQIRRPGCAEPPNFADILIDSRWQIMPLIQEGYVAKASFSNHPSGGEFINIATPTLGYKPIVLTMWHFSPTTVATNAFFEPFVTYETYPPGQEGFRGFTFYVGIADGEFQLRSYMQRPTSYAFVSGAWTAVSEGFWWDRFVGVRYYVFAIPQG